MKKKQVSIFKPLSAKSTAINTLIKYYGSLILFFIGCNIASAQLADGFYHIKNAGTGRYLSFNDTDPNNYQVSTQSGSVNLGGIRTYINYDSVAVSPSCVIYVKQLGEGKYDLHSQGSSLYAMTNYKLPIDITPNGNGTYKISGTASGITTYLTDRSPSNDDGYLISSGDMVNWTLEPINTSNEFIAIHPDVKTADGNYYGTIFAGFNFRLVSPGMTAFYISNAGGTSFTMSPIEGDVIPAGIPVIIKCSSANIEDNKIEPVIGGYVFEQSNWLGGVYCSLKAAKHNNFTLFDRITMRILGLAENGELAFIATPSPDRLYKEEYLMANKAYLKVNSGDADVIILTTEMKKKCEKPIISYNNGEITFSCETDGVEFVSQITAPDAKNYNDVKINLKRIYAISVYAKKAGYYNSDTATAEITVEGDLRGDLTGDGVVNVADHVELSKIIMGLP